MVSMIKLENGDVNIHACSTVPKRCELRPGANQQQGDIDLSQCRAAMKHWDTDVLRRTYQGTRSGLARTLS